MLSDTYIRLERISQETKTRMARRKKFLSAKNALSSNQLKQRRRVPTALALGFSKGLEFRTVSWQEKTAGQVCLYERITRNAATCRSYASSAQAHCPPITGPVCQIQHSSLSSALLSAKGVALKWKNHWRFKWN